MKKLLLFLLIAFALLLGAQDANVSPVDKDAEIARLKDENHQQQRIIDELQARVNQLEPDKSKPASGPAQHSKNRSIHETPATTDASNQGQSPSRPLDYGLILSIAIPAVIILCGVLVWFLIVAPRRRRKPLVAALTKLARDDPGTFPEIESLLGMALTAGLGEADVAEARFALAYIRTRLGRYGEAEASLAEMEAAGGFPGEAAYLKLWVLARQKKHDEVEAFYDRAAKLLSDIIDANRIAGISFLHLGRKNLALRATQVALDYFDRIRTLGVLADQVPADLADHQFAFGLNSAFETNWPEARKHFQAAADSSKGDSPNARLGLLLCDWRETPSADIDEELSALLPAVEAAYRKHAQAKAAKAGQGRGEPQKKKSTQDSDPDEATLLLAGCRLWHVFSLLRGWTLCSEKTRPPKEEMDALATRSAAVKEIGPGMAEPYLVEGLIAYYFSYGDAQARAAAIRGVEKARDLEMSVPEVLLLLEHEHEQQRQVEDGARTYVKLLRSYLGNQEIPERIRRKVREELARFERFKNLEEIEISSGNRDVAPSVAELQARVEIMHNRITELVRPRLSWDSNQAAKDELDTLSNDIRETTNVLREKAAHLESAEAKITIYVGEFLLPEEPQVTEPLPAEEITAPLLEGADFLPLKKPKASKKEN